MSKIIGGQPVPKNVCNLVYGACSKIKAQARGRLSVLVEYIARGKIDSETKLGCALEFVLSNPQGELNVQVRSRASM